MVFMEHGLLTIYIVSMSIEGTFCRNVFYYAFGVRRGLKVKKKRMEVVKIFSDSQSAVCLLTLDWTPSSYQGKIGQIKKQIEGLK